MSLPWVPCLPIPYRCLWGWMDKEDKAKRFESLSVVQLHFDHPDGGSQDGGRQAVEQR